MKRDDGHDGLELPGDAMLPLSFGGAGCEAKVYLDDPVARGLLEFFENKGIAALKDEDRREAFYFDWLEYQRRHGIYAAVLTPAK